MELALVEKLADELIELRCERHSVGNVYEWLLKAYGDAKRAKAEFIRFMSGELPTRILETASEWIADEQGYDTKAGNSCGNLFGGGLTGRDPGHAADRRAKSLPELLKLFGCEDLIAPVDEDTFGRRAGELICRKEAAIAGASQSSYEVLRMRPPKETQRTSRRLPS